MQTEFFTFELIMHFEPSLEGSIDGLKEEIRTALKNVKEVQDIELTLTDNGRTK